MLNRSASLAMSTSVLKALPGKLDIKRHSSSILYLTSHKVASRYQCSVAKWHSMLGQVDRHKISEIRLGPYALLTLMLRSYFIPPSTVTQRCVIGVLAPCLV